MNSEGDENLARFAPYLAETVEESWARCLPIWMERGRVNDLPRGRRVPYHLPSFGMLLGRQFVAHFADNYEFLVERMMSGSESEQLCAFDLLDFLALQLYSNGEPLPEQLRECVVPLPPVILPEIAMEARYRDHDVSTIGKLLSFDCCDEIDV